MNIFNFYSTILKVIRALAILHIIIKHSIINSYNRAYNLFSRSKRKIESTSERIRIIIEELGPTFVKFGQLMADRPDVISERFCVELKKLQNDVDPFDSKIALELIESELGESVDTLFKEFDTQPIAAASIGQAYNAVLKNGCPVVVKIQRPNIENKIKLDIHLMKYLAKYFAKRNPDLMSLNIIGLVNDFAETIMEELDYTKEAANTELFSHLFRENKTVKIPHVWNRYTTEKLLVMERIIGTTPDSAEVLEEAGLDPDEVINNGANAIFQMIFIHGVFHADPHPGNIFILKGNRIAFIDFGIISLMRRREMDFIVDYSLGYARKDIDRITKALIDLCGDKFITKEAEVRYDIRRMMIRNMNDKELDLNNFSATLRTSIDIIIKHKMQIPSGIFSLLRTLMTLEKLSLQLHASIDMSSLILPFSQDIIQKRHSTKRFVGELYDATISYVNMFKEFPTNVNEILYKLKEGRIKHEIHLEDEKLFNKTFRQMTLRVSYVILLIGMFIGSSILMVMDYETKFGPTIMYISSILIFFLIISWIFRKRTN